MHWKKMCCFWKVFLNMYVYFTLIPFLVCECCAIDRTFRLPLLVRTYQSRAHGLSLFAAPQCNVSLQSHMYSYNMYALSSSIVHEYSACYIIFKRILKLWSVWNIFVEVDNATTYMSASFSLLLHIIFIEILSHLNRLDLYWSPFLIAILIGNIPETKINFVLRICLLDWLSTTLGHKLLWYNDLLFCLLFNLKKNKLSKKRTRKL